MRLDLAYNGDGASKSDALTSSMLKNKAGFGWINHTWGHAYLGCQVYVVPGDTSSGCATWMSATAIADQISLNQTWAQKNSLSNYKKNELVTAQHSGLDNPNMPTALAKTGITVIASDASRAQQQTIGQAVTAPRHPSNVYYNVTWSDQLDEYVQLHLPPALARRQLRQHLDHDVPLAGGYQGRLPRSQDEDHARARAVPTTRALATATSPTSPRPHHPHPARPGHRHLPEPVRRQRAACHPDAGRLSGRADEAEPVGGGGSERSGDGLCARRRHHDQGQRLDGGDRPRHGTRGYDDHIGHGVRRRVRRLGVRVAADQRRWSLTLKLPAA